MRNGVSHNLGYLYGVPISRIIVFWGLHWGSLILGNCQLGVAIIGVTLVVSHFKALRMTMRGTPEKPGNFQQPSHTTELRKFVEFS